MDWILIPHSQKDPSEAAMVVMCAKCPYVKRAHVGRYFIAVLLIERTILRGTTGSDWSKHPCHLPALKVVVPKGISVFCIHM